jgi:3-oxoacyl-(acyl-carrier-protein) synthase
MDRAYEPTTGVAMSEAATIVLTGIACTEGDPRASPAVNDWLASRKSRKYMGKQDELAVMSAGQAITGAGLRGCEALSGAGLYWTIGHIPFERAEIEAIARKSLDPHAQFSMHHFATEGIEQVNPLLTFRCLPNMPAFHISLNFGICGPYLVSYPGIAQFYSTLQQACRDLRQQRVVHAVVGAVADQQNFLVDFYFQRATARRSLHRKDAAGCLCLELASTARSRGATVLAQLSDVTLGYDPDAPAAQAGAAASCTDLIEGLAQALQRADARYTHRAQSLDYGQLASLWVR